VAALRASRPADQPRARSLRRLGQRRVHDLYQFAIPRRKPHAPRIKEEAPVAAETSAPHSVIAISLHS
jgi:hypothetical protein